MNKTLMCATAAAAMMSASQFAHAEDGWYVRGDLEYAFDGTLDYDVVDPTTIGGIGSNADV